jgi:hypothetical protein
MSVGTNRRSRFKRNLRYAIAYGRVQSLAELKEKTHRMNKDNVIEMEERIPWVYSKGICTGDLSKALAAVGTQTPPSSASTTSRLKTVGEEKPEEQQNRDLSPQLGWIYFSMSTSLKNGVATGVGS